MLAISVTLSTMEQEISDEDLMLQYRNGDAMAFECLYKRYKDAIYRYMFRLCRNEAIAEELYQDVWMKLINSRERYEVKAKFKTYLYQIAHNRFVDHYRKQRGKNTLDSNNIEQQSLEEIVDDGNQQPDQKLMLQQQTQHFFKLLDALPEEQREVFVLREESAMSLAQIAEATGVNEETAKSRLRYALKKLRQGLA